MRAGPLLDVGVAGAALLLEADRPGIIIAEGRDAKELDICI